MAKVRPKKHLGQHFLQEEETAKAIVSSLSNDHNYSSVLEVGPGMGMLTKYLLERTDFSLHAVELDRECADYLNNQFNSLQGRLYQLDFLETDWTTVMPGSFGLIGNFPYNISSQILFAVLKMKNSIPEIVCMLQKEVAVRIAGKPGTKAYGILSVLLQAYYSIELLMHVPPEAFCPSPKVESSVIRLVRNNITQLDCNETLFVKVVKQAFQNRRKTLRNALKPINLPADIIPLPLFDLRAEQLEVNDFISLTSLIEENWKK